MHYIWDVDRAESHIDKLCDSVEDVEIANYTRKMDLDNIPVNKAYEMDAVHIYVDILNLEESNTLIIRGASRLVKARIEVIFHNQLQFIDVCVERNDKFTEADYKNFNKSIS